MINRLKTFFITLFIFVFCNCSNNSEIDTLPSISDNTIYSISNDKILRDATPIHLKGVNALNTYGINNHELMDQWKIEIVREFIGNLREQPIDGEFAILGADNKWIHPLQKIVDANRKHHKITILCPFGWVFENGNSILFTGLNPTEQDFYNAYKVKMKEIANHFKNQNDVWVETWNEPYHWNNEKSYSHDLWLNNQIEMVDNLRSVDGFNNIILVAGNEQGQSENAILAKGKELLANRFNILFDIHAYEKWLVNASVEDNIARIEKLNNQGFAIIFGEVGVVNIGDLDVLMNPNNFFMAVNQTKTTTLAWLWNANTSDQNSLLTDNNQENNFNNNNWGTTFRNFLND